MEQQIIEEIQRRMYTLHAVVSIDTFVKGVAETVGCSPQQVREVMGNSHDEVAA